MPELTPTHLDELVLLRHAAGNLDDIERARAERHLGTCRICAAVLEDMRRLDAELRLLAQDAGARAEWEQIELPPGDPFRRRPQIAAAARNPRPDGLAALEASERAGAPQQRILDATSDPRRLAGLLADLDLGDAVNRFALLYALQESGREIAGSPVRALRFAEEVLARLRREPSASDAAHSDAERIVPGLALLGQAYVLAGQACNWACEYERAKAHFELAYRSFARAGGDEVSFAIVEYHESQRRSFIGRGHEALVLARRAAATFQALELEGLYARAKAAEGLAFSKLGRHEDALAAYRVALPVFVRGDLLSNYVGTLNSIGTALHKLGRLDEARREYARALRGISRERHRSFLAFIRHGLADVLFSAGHYRDAALSLAQAGRLYSECGLSASALKASLFEIESWARSGDPGRARHRLEIFREEVARRRALDPSVARQIEAALAGQDPDLQKVAELRQQAEGVLSERLQGTPA